MNKYPRTGFVVQKVTQRCNTEGCTAPILTVLPWEDYGADTFNDLTEGLTRGEHSEGNDYEGMCFECGKPVMYDDYFVVTDDANNPREVSEPWNMTSNVVSETVAVEVLQPEKVKIKNVKGEVIHVVDNECLVNPTSLKDSNLKMLDLSGADFSGVNLEGADFTHSKLTNANFKNAYLKGANFFYADLSGADLSDCDLSGVKFCFAEMTNVNLSHSDLRKADFTGADLTGANFTGTFPSDCKFSGGKLLNIIVKGVQLENIDLENDDCRQMVMGHLIECWRKNNRLSSDLRDYIRSLETERVM